MKNSNLAETRSENEGAFTLVELLVVILIIGILAAIAIPAFLNQRKAAVDSSVESDVKNASTQVETWAVANPNKEIPFITAENNGSGTVVSGFNIAGTALADIEVGEGTVLLIDLGTEKGSYTIQGINEDGNRAADDDSTFVTEGIVFVSNDGGLQDGNTVPGAATAPGPVPMG